MSVMVENTVNGFCPQHRIRVAPDNACSGCIGETHIPRLWPGDTFVIIGGGTSVTAEDVDRCHGKARVIAIKEAHCLAPWADVLYACEAKWWEYYRGAGTFTGLKYALRPDPKDHPRAAADLKTLQRYPDLQLIRHSGEFGLELQPNAVRHGYNSGYQAINLAVHLGAARIVLLGFDMSKGIDGTQNWFGPHPNHSAPSPYPIFIQAMSTLVEPLKAAGIEVINASRFTVLTAFPRLSLEEALS